MFDLTLPWPPGVNRKTWIIYGLGGVAILLLLAQTDSWAARSIGAWPEGLRVFLAIITDYGRSEWILVCCAIVFVLAVLAGCALRGLARLACYEISMLAGYVAAGVGLPGLASNGIKRIVGRARPAMFDEYGAFSFHGLSHEWSFQSFPSGHSTIAIALAFTVGFVAPRLFLWLLGIGVVVCFSRIPLGMHYPSDVFAGFCLGLIGAYGVRRLFASRGWLFRIRANGRITPRPLSAVKRLYRRARA